MRITSSTSMNGIRLISGSSFWRGRKFMIGLRRAVPRRPSPLGGRRSARSAKRGGSFAAQRVQVPREAFGGQLQGEQVFVHAHPEVAPEDQRGNRHDEPERGVV